MDQIVLMMKTVNSNRKMINKKKMKIIAEMGMMREKKMKRKKGKNRQGKMKNTWKKGWTNMKSTKQKLKYKGLMSRIFK